MYPLLNELRIINGKALNDQVALLVMVMDDVAFDKSQPHAVVYLLDEDTAQYLEAFPFSVTSALFLNEDKKKPMVIGDWGEVRIIQNGGIIEETIPYKRGPLRRAVCIENQVFVSGTALQAFRRSGDGEWSDISPVVSDYSQYTDHHLESIDGFSETELYAAGRHGIIWYFDGKVWQAITCPTNASFYDVTCGSDGIVYLCGQFGVMAKGRYDAFELIEPEEQMADLWGVARYSGTTFASGFTALVSVEEGFLTPVSSAMRLAEHFYDLDCKNGTLWSFGMKDVLKNNGTGWQRIDGVNII